jgi:hypothetical protein
MARHYPNVFYVGPYVEGLILEPILLGLRQLANVRTFLVRPTLSERVGGRFIRPPGNANSSPAAAARKRRARSPILSRILSLSRGAYDLRSERMEPDLIFVADVFRNIEGLSSFSCPKVYYVQDPHVSLSRYFDFARVQEYDFVLATQKDYIATLEDEGCKNVSWLPYACDPDLLLGPPEQRDLDVSFVGTPYPQRQALLSTLDEVVQVFRSRAYLRDMAAVFRRSKIVFNKSLNGDLNMRVFEAMCSGAMLVTDRIGNGLLEIFKENHHLATYSDGRELKQVVAHYLREDAERSEIASRGQAEVLSRHTYLHRAAAIFQTCLGMDLSAEVERKVTTVKAGNQPYPVE